MRLVRKLVSGGRRGGEEEKRREGMAEEEEKRKRRKRADVPAWKKNVHTHRVSEKTDEDERADWQRQLKGAAAADGERMRHCYSRCESTR